MSHSLGKHGLATSGRSEHEHASWRINANLFVQLKVSEWQLDGLSHLLLLQVKAAYVHVGHIGLLVGSQHGYARVGLGRQYVNKSVGVLVQGNTRARLINHSFVINISNFTTIKEEEIIRVLSRALGL